MIGIVDVEVQAKNPNMPLWPLRAYVNSPTSLRLRNVPRKIGNWQITSVNFQVTYPDGAIASADCVLVGGVWVGTVDGTSTPGTSDFGYAIYASGIDEHGNPVTGYCLGKGDVEILDDQGEVTPSEHATYTKLLSAEPADPQNGNIWQVSGTYYIQQFGQTWPIGDDSGLIGELSTKLDDKADLSAVPTKTSDLTNDSGFITSADIITKRDLNDFNVYVDPMADITTTKFTVVVSYAFDPSTPLFTAELTHASGEATRWLYSPSGSNQRIIIDYYSYDGSYNLSYLNIQDGGGTEHSGSMTTPLTSPYWTGEVQDDWFHFSVTSQTTTITTKAYVDSLIDELSAKADLSAIPTKTSELSNDSGFIQQNGIAVIHDLTCDQLVANQAYIAGYATNEWVEGQDYATKTYAVQNLGGVAKIQSIELSDYQAISATADLSTLYVIPEET